MARSAARSTVGLGIGFVLAGVFFDSESLYVPGIALVVLAGASWAWVELAAKGATLAVSPGPSTVVEEEPYPVRVEVGAGSVPLRAVLEHPLLEHPVSVGISRAGRTEEARVEPIRRAEEAGGDRGEGALDRFVWGAGGVGLDASAIDVEIDGLRPYRDGSPASRIHWPAVARSRELLERRLVAGGSEAPLVVLDAENPSSTEALDQAVRAAASLCLYLALRGGCMLLLSGDRHPQRVDRQLRGWPAAHARLALVEAGAGLPAMARSVTGTVFWVTGGSPVVALGRQGVRTACVVTPNPLPGRPSLFEVAGCQGQALRGSRATASRARSAA